MVDVSDNIDDIVPTTDSARRVVELVRLYGKGYVAGELSLARGMALTGSEIPTICAENRFEDPITCFFNKIYGKEQVDNENTRHGKEYEPICIAKFKKQTGAKIFFVTFMRSEDYPFLGGTYDFLAIMPDGEGVLGEVKCPLKRSIGNSIPPQYVGQVQTYLEIAKLKTCLFVQYKPAYVTPARKWQRPEKLVITRVAYDPAYFRVRMSVLWEFWCRVCAWRAAILPTADLAIRVLVAAWRVRKGRTTLLKAKLACHFFKNIRMAHRGVFHSTMEEMEKSKPKICDSLNGPLVIDTKQAEVHGAAIKGDSAMDTEPIRLVVSVPKKDAWVAPDLVPAAQFAPAAEPEKPLKLVISMGPSANSMPSMVFAAAAMAANAATKAFTTALAESRQGAVGGINKRAFGEDHPRWWPSPKKFKQDIADVSTGPVTTTQDDGITGPAVEEGLEPKAGDIVVNLDGSTGPYNPAPPLIKAPRF